jgi:transcriptional regulator with XRE-family HTH domain
MPRDVIELIESVRVGMEMTKLELARRSGVSRGHVQELLADPDPRPHVETVVRLAVGLDYPLEIVGVKEERFDDADPAMPGNERSTTRPEGTGWQHATTFSGTMFGGSVLPLLLGGHRAAYAGLGVLGAATVAVGVRYLEAPRHRETACFVGAGLVAAAVFGLIRGGRGGPSDAT